MATTIKAIEAQSVHQIQSGQVIVDLCSVVKELVENGLDAGANSIEVRFKNNGLDSIEVQDNGSGISPANYESVALKHHTSKLSVYDDLSSLQTFGFRGEALSSLCALSTFYMTTAQADEEPKGNRLDFEISGKLKSTSVVACQKGTIATVERLFDSLPVRRKELVKNIKREYGKVVGLLHAYACVCIGVKFAVKNTMPKGKSVTVFATKANTTTRENIANVYGAKTLHALVALDLELDFHSNMTQISQNDTHATRVIVNGHISRPAWGEGRQTPDRQMFFVNGRPCGLPQVAKAMNEVYKSFNVSQSPFIFADLQMDTNAYDVNVSPDKRTILLHNATRLIEKLKETLNALFEKQDQTVPQSQVTAPKPPAFKQLSIQRTLSAESAASDVSHGRGESPSSESQNGNVSASDDEGDKYATTRYMLQDHFRAQASTREELPTKIAFSSGVKIQNDKRNRAEKVTETLAAQERVANVINKYDHVRDVRDVENGDSVENNEETQIEQPENIKVRDFNQRMAEQQKRRESADQLLSEASPSSETSQEREASMDLLEQPDHPNVVQNAFDWIRPQRPQAEVATITIGDHATTAIVGSSLTSRRDDRLSDEPFKRAKQQKAKPSSIFQFSQSLRKFGAPGTQLEEEDSASTEDLDDPNNPVDQDSEAENSDGESLQPPADQFTRWQKTDPADEASSDPQYVDQAEEKAEEEARVAELIRLAEESSAQPCKESLKRANTAFKASHHKDSTRSLVSHLGLSLAEFEAGVASLNDTRSESAGVKVKTKEEIDSADVSAEEQLSLTVARSDFAEMDIIGQFNLGFVLAVRKGSDTSQDRPSQSAKLLRDELFIIDQHASDEKYNFERLQATTVVSNQRLVRAILLDLTAVEEEIVIENLPSLEKNGFIVEIDASGDSPVGRRCKLITLPLSKEVTFDTRDLDELIHLLAESPALSAESQVPRPTKVRKMFAMRACRSSIMIGKTLSKRQMSDVLRHMGEIDKPWNCPHGRPTMRHLTSLDVLGGWREGSGLADAENRADEMGAWKHYSSS